LAVRAAAINKTTRRQLLTTAICSYSQRHLYANIRPTALSRPVSPAMMPALFKATASVNFTSDRRYFDRACLLVSSFVRSLRSLRCLDKLKSSFHETWYSCSASVPNSTIDFSQVKVKFQGQNHRTENLPLVIAQS